MLPHPLTNFEIRKYYQSEPILNGLYSRDNLPNKIKDETFVINLDAYFDIGTHWIALHVLNDNVNYFDSFGVEHIPKEVKKFIGNKYEWIYKTNFNEFIKKLKVANIKRC